MLAVCDKGHTWWKRPVRYGRSRFQRGVAGAGSISGQRVERVSVEEGSSSCGGRGYGAPGGRRCRLRGTAAAVAGPRLRQPEIRLFRPFEMQDFVSSFLSFLMKKMNGFL